MARLASSLILLIRFGNQVLPSSHADNWLVENQSDLSKIFRLKETKVGKCDTNKITGVVIDLI